MPSSCCWQSSNWGEEQLSNWSGWEEREPVWFPFFFAPFVLKLKTELFSVPLRGRGLAGVRSLSLQSLLHRRSSAARTRSGVPFQHVKHGGFAFQTFNTSRLLHAGAHYITRSGERERRRRKKSSQARVCFRSERSLSEAADLWDDYLVGSQSRWV